MSSHKEKLPDDLLALARKRTQEIRLELEFWSQLLRDDRTDRSRAPLRPEETVPHSAARRKRANAL